MRQSVEATRNNPAVQAAQAAMAERPGQGQGQGQGPGQGLGPRSASGRRAALSGADQGTMAVQSRQILEEMSKHAWWRAGQVRLGLGLGLGLGLRVVRPARPRQ